MSDIEFDRQLPLMHFIVYSINVLPVSSKKSASRRKRSVADENMYSVTFRAYKCYYVDCIAPVDPNTVPPVTKRPYDFNYWSEKETWKNAQNGWGGYISNGSYDLPKDGDNVKIDKGISALTVL